MTSTSAKVRILLLPGRMIWTLSAKNRDHTWWRTTRKAYHCQYQPPKELLVMTITTRPYQHHNQKRACTVTTTITLFSPPPPPPPFQTKTTLSLPTIQLFPIHKFDWWDEFLNNENSNNNNSCTSPPYFVASVTHLDWWDLAPASFLFQFWTISQSFGITTRN